MPRESNDRSFSDNSPPARPRPILVRSEEGGVESGETPPLDSRLLDFEPEQESPFLRAQKRVQVRRGPLPKKAANRLKYALEACAIAGACIVAVLAVARYARSSPRFRLESSDQIQVQGTGSVNRADVTDVFGADISRNVFLIPLELRKQQLERIPWVESATVMRLLPNIMQVDLRERTPVAFVQLGTRIDSTAEGALSVVGAKSGTANQLIDAHGVIMDAVPGARYSFPVLLGFSGVEPLSTRAARMRIFQKLKRELDSGGANYSRDLSEIDLSDPDDVKIGVIDRHGEVLVHLGKSRFLDRYKVFVSHVQEWRQQTGRLDSVDLRFDGRAIVNPGKNN